MGLEIVDQYNRSKQMTQNDDQSIMLEISKLVPWDQNPRLNDDAVDAVALSIQEFGWTNPILARAEDLMVIAGHTRLKAAKQLGLDVVPVRVLDVSETQAKQIAIADNKLGELAFWDETLLSELLAGFELEELGPLGFDENELDKILDNQSDHLEDFTEDNHEFVYQIIIEDLTERTQAELFERLEMEGYKCRPLTV